MSALRALKASCMEFYKLINNVLTFYISNLWLETVGSFKPRLPVPPYNPELRKLVEGKSSWDARARTVDKRAGFRGWHERGYLPHRDSPGLIQFVTFHLSDAFPSVLRAEWAALLQIEKERERRKQLEEYLDKGRGESWLRRVDIARVCQEALLHFHGERYALKAWCLMPNHVHVLVLVTTVPMSEFIKGWKGFSAREANVLLKREGQSFWAEDYWDTYMRDEEQERRAVLYIENNPVKAGLTQFREKWVWSSARFRDQYGRLDLDSIGVNDS